MEEQLILFPGLTLYGAGGHCKVVIDILESVGKRIKQIVDDSPSNSTFMSIPCKKPEGKYDSVIVTIGNCQIRRKIVENIKVNHFETAIHPSAVVSPHSSIGEGSVVMQGAIIQSGSLIGKHVIINTQASIDHDCKIADFVHIAPGSILSGNVEVGECSWIGVGVCIKNGMTIGKNCIIGAGSVVVKDIPDNVVAFGNPCKVMRTNE